MDNAEGRDQPVGRRIALGLTIYLTGFATRRNAQVWREFAIEAPMDWRFYFLEFADDPGTTIFFNLHRVDVKTGLTRAATGRGTPTDWELFQIHEHPSWWPRMEWWDQDVHLPNPFDRGSVP